MHGLGGEHHEVSGFDELAGARGDDVCSQIGSKAIVDHGHADALGQGLCPQAEEKIAAA